VSEGALRPLVIWVSEGALRPLVNLICRDN